MTIVVKGLLLLLTLVAPVYVVFFLYTFNDSWTSEELDKLFDWHMIVTVTSWLMMVVYLLLVFKLDNVKRNQRGIWVAALLFGSVIAMPVFWFLYVWPYRRSSKPRIGRDA